ncbi:MAG: hypothetical protein HZB50_02855 [Chloroflexi bacterium]|nr:hypothetical protein [Chloroflexota bacterium]
MNPLDRVFLLGTVLLSAYQIVVGIDALSTAPIIAYTIAFGVLLVAGLLLIILGFEGLDSPVVVIISTVIPLALALGLVWEHLASFRGWYLIFVIAGFAAVTYTRSTPIHNHLPVIMITITHGIAGLTIFLLPIFLSIQGATKPAFALVGIGGALIGICGLLLSFLKTGKPILPREVIFRAFPIFLLLTTICFVTGFKFG